jgi:Arc/MetJ-type ribon-helix-helix transcriptional regulator
MANSPLVSVRIPPETLERVDRLAQKLYPPRRAGRQPNRSQVILDAIEQFLTQHESGFARLLNVNPEIVDQPIHFLVHQKSEEMTNLDTDVQIDAQIDMEKMSEAIRQNPKRIEPSVREYIDWWFDYFSYLKKLKDVWFDAK